MLIFFTPSSVTDAGDNSMSPAIVNYPEKVLHLPPRLWHPQGVIHFKEETISLCHPEQSEGSLAGPRSFALLRMTRLHRLRLTRNSSYLSNSSYLKCIARKGCHYM